MYSTGNQQLDEEAPSVFGRRMLDVLNGASLALSISIGHRTGLFDAMSDGRAVSSTQLAQKLGLQERYVREWLGAMVTGSIVDYAAEERQYRLPAEHAALLTPTTSSNNVGNAMGFIAALGKVEDQVIDCFRDGGGLPYSAYDRFREVMAADSQQTVVTALDEHILPAVPGLTEKLRIGIDVLDIGCGFGGAICEMARLFPNSRFAGYDSSNESIATASQLAISQGLSNARFEVKDVARIGEYAFYDLITAFDAIHDQRDPARVLGEVYAALRPGSTFLMQEIKSSSNLENNIEHPIGPFLYTVSTMHCMTVSLALGGAGLGACWGEELALEMLRAAGFRSIQVHQLPHDFFNSYFVATN